MITPPPLLTGFPGGQEGSEMSHRRPVSVEEPVRAFGGYNRPGDILFDFDPRFENSRILLANVHFVQQPRHSDSRRFSLGEGFFEAQAPCLSLVRLPSWQKIAKTGNFGGVPGRLNSPLLA